MPIAISPPPMWLIVGLGWLGQALQEALRADGVAATGTHRADFNFFQHELPAGPWDVIFLNTPPLLELSPADYAAKVLRVTAKRIIFISSTSVYGSRAGDVTEADPPSPDTRNGEWLAAVEQELRTVIGDRLLVIRPGGLIGGERHPVKQLQGRTGLGEGNHPVNLIHRVDLLTIIREAPEHIGLINATAPAHPRRDTYYTEWAHKLSLAPPTFFESAHAPRVVRSRVLSQFLSHWQCPSLDWI